jgi:excinuclease UvrABC ATPase subunit
VREEFERYQNNRPIATCGGFRLKPEALAVKHRGLHIGASGADVDPRGPCLDRPRAAGR